MKKILSLISMSLLAISAQAMYEACMAAWPQHDMAILCAAVADFTPAQVAEQKIKKENFKLSSLSFQLSLKETPDIARALGETKRNNQQLIGFALETQNEKKNALQKNKKS